MIFFGFIRSLDHKICARIWDSFFLEGELYAIKTGLGILKYYEMELRLSTFDEAVNLLKKPSSNTNGDALFQLIEHIKVINLDKNDF